MENRKASELLFPNLTHYKLFAFLFYAEEIIVAHHRPEERGVHSLPCASLTSLKVHWRRLTGLKWNIQNSLVSYICRVVSCSEVKLPSWEKKTQRPGSSQKWSLKTGKAYLQYYINNAHPLGTKDGQSSRKLVQGASGFRFSELSLTVIELPLWH